MRPLSALPAFFALIGLTSCAGSTKPSPPSFCPRVAVLEQGQNLDEYLPGRTDVAALITQAQITGVAGACVEIKDHNMLRVTFRAGFAASNGPANHNAALVLPYFVAVTDGETIVSKTPYSITLSFDGNQSTTSAVSQPVNLELPNTPESATVDILVGFQLTPEQLARPNPSLPAAIGP